MLNVELPSLQSGCHPSSCPQSLRSLNHLTSLPAAFVSLLDARQVNTANLGAQRVNITHKLHTPAPFFLFFFSPSLSVHAVTRCTSKSSRRGHQEPAGKRPPTHQQSIYPSGQTGLMKSETRRIRRPRRRGPEIDRRQEV